VICSNKIQFSEFFSLLSFYNFFDEISNTVFIGWLFVSFLQHLKITITVLVAEIRLEKMMDSSRTFSSFITSK
jgi:ABC-type polysaccharide transport system permease subunit